MSLIEPEPFDLWDEREVEEPEWWDAECYMPLELEDLWMSAPIHTEAPAPKQRRAA